MIQVRDFPIGLSNPALRALVSAGHASLKDVARASEKEIANLHGMGPSGVKMLRAALGKAGLAFRQT